MKEKIRCDWVNLKNPLYVDYHDNEWGRPLKEDNKLFEALILDGAQAGLSWETILNKRKHYEKVYDNFDPKKVAKYNEKKIAKLLVDPGIIRNKLKINSSIKNAKVFIEIQKEFGSFSDYLWAFVKHKPIKHKIISIKNYPTKDLISEAISKDLKQRGMNFVGPTIIYAMMQAIGMVNDHQTKCFRYKK